jgi:NTP pyrophosphatase (non-canonical NTP hydrolase)
MSMVEGYNALAGTQTDINRRLLRRIEALENAETGEAADITDIKGDVKDIQDAIGDESTANSILGRIKALEDAE